MNDLITLFARFTVTGFPGGSVELACTRCGDVKVFLPGAHDDPALSELAIWARDHRCPEDFLLRPARELVAV